MRVLCRHVCACLLWSCRFVFCSAVIYAHLLTATRCSIPSPLTHPHAFSHTHLHTTKHNTSTGCTALLWRRGLHADVWWHRYIRVLVLIAA